MAIKVRGVPSHGKGEMTLEEFKRWLGRFDTNKDGRISKEELQAAIQVAGRRRWFTGLKSKRGVQYADNNGDGFIDENEVIYLRVFAHKHLGIKIVDFDQF